MPQRAECEGEPAFGRHRGSHKLYSVADRMCTRPTLTELNDAAVLDSRGNVDADAFAPVLAGGAS